VYPVPLDPGDSTALNLRVVNRAYRLARVESRYEPPITVILSQLGVQCHRSCTKIPLGASGTAIPFRPAQSETYRSARVESGYEPPITMILSQIGIQCHRPCIKRPLGASCGAVSSSGASRICFDPAGKSTRALLPKPPQTRSLVSWESNVTGPARKYYPYQPVHPRQARLPVGSASRPDCTNSGLFLPAESPDSLCHFSDYFLHPGASPSMSGNSLNRSRGDFVSSSKPKEPLGLTPREVC
ncbi:hypothetical protein CRG98_013729, partial [Punica granatum]